MSIFNSSFPFRLVLIFTIISLGACNESVKNDPDTEFFTQNPWPLHERPVAPLAIGAPAPDFSLPGTDGQYHSLEDFKDANVLVIIFTCNHCPTAQAYEDRIIKIAEDYKDKGVNLVAISPNSPLGLLYEELGYSDLNDDFSEMVIRASDKKFNFPYLYDGDTEEASILYGPAATPHAYVFDQDRKLQYRGRLDKIEKPGEANAEDVRQAIDALLEGREPEIKETKTFGCSTKWAWKTKLKESVDAEWAEKEVTLEEASLEEISGILANSDSEKLRLVNIWATWCGPCILEYPGFVAIQRMYGARDFEFISISMDKLSQKSKALKFLVSKESALPNYISSIEDKYAVIEAVDPEWNGALPYTVLIEPGGKIVWKHQGSVDFYELKKVIVENSMIGRYY